MNTLPNPSSSATFLETPLCTSTRLQGAAIIIRALQGGHKRITMSDPNALDIDEIEIDIHIICLIILCLIVICRVLITTILQRTLMIMGSWIRNNLTLFFIFSIFFSFVFYRQLNFPSILLWNLVL
jgi:hypothetical protein